MFDSGVTDGIYRKHFANEGTSSASSPGQSAEEDKLVRSSCISYSFLTGPGVV